MTATTTALTVRFPGAPDLDLSANRRDSQHWRKRAMAVADLKRMNFDTLARSLAPAEPLVGPLRYDATICWPTDQRELDFDGAVSVLKAYVDLLPDAGWMRTDFQIKAAHVTQVKADGPGWVEISVEVLR